MKNPKKAQAKELKIQSSLMSVENSAQNANFFNSFSVLIHQYLLSNRRVLCILI